MLARVFFKKCGKRKLISKNASGNSGAHMSSFQALGGGGIIGGSGMYLFQPLGVVPPGVPTAPASTVRNSSALETCHPPRLPAAAFRQTWVATADPARPISRATSTIMLASTPDSLAANSGV